MSLIRVENELEALVGQTLEARGLPGISAAIGLRGRVLWAGAIGQANSEDGVALDTDHHLRCASITKLFTATAVFQQRDAGAISLDDPIARHLPEASHLSLTFADALCHRGAVVREVPGDVWATLEFPRAQEFLTLLADLEISSRPRWHYSNNAYILAGLAIARSAGKPFDELVMRGIVEPLGLGRTGFAPERAAQGYLRHRATDTTEPEAPVVLGDTAPQGGLWSTPSDLCQFAAVLTGDRPDVLAPESAAEMCALRVMLDDGAWSMGWGYGPGIFRRGDRTFPGHGGAIPGYSSGVYVNRASGLSAAAQCNARGDTWAMGDLSLALMEAVLDAEPSLLQAA